MHLATEEGQHLVKSEVIDSKKCLERAGVHQLHHAVLAACQHSTWMPFILIFIEYCNPILVLRKAHLSDTTMMPPGSCHAADKHAGSLGETDLSQKSLLLEGLTQHAVKLASVYQAHLLHVTKQRRWKVEDLLIISTLTGNPEHDLRGCFTLLADDKQMWCLECNSNTEIGAPHLRQNLIKETRGTLKKAHHAGRRPRNISAESAGQPPRGCSCACACPKTCHVTSRLISLLEHP